MPTAPPAGRSARVLAAAVAAIRPRGHGFDHPIDDAVLAGVQSFLPFLPPTLRLAFPLGLRLLDASPPFVLGRWRRFSSLPLADAHVLLERLLERGGPLGALVLGLRALVFLAFYQHPEVLRTMEVDWADRARMLTRRRALLVGS